MSDNGPNIDSLRGVQPELWTTLENLWGSDITGPLHKLPLAQNHKGPYHQCLNPPDGPECHSGKINPEINLLEIRYGRIKSIAEKRWSVWFVVENQILEDMKPISERSLLSIGMQFLTVIDEATGAEDTKSFRSEEFPINVIKPVDHEGNRYVLLEMIVHSDFWPSALRVLKPTQDGRIGPGQRLVIHLQDSLSGFRYRCAIWQADANWFRFRPS